MKKDIQKKIKIKKMDIKDPIIERVVNKIIERSNAGIEKYGTTLAENNTDCFLKHAQEEAMDLANYLEKMIQQKKASESKQNQPSPSKRLRNVMFLVHQSNNMQEDFEDYYKSKMEEIINHFKNKINE